MMEFSLKECPICGNEVEMVVTSFSDFVQIHCICGFGTYKSMPIYIAKTMWNTRPILKEIKWPYKYRAYEYVYIDGMKVIDKRYNAGWNNAIDACKKALGESK